MTEDVIRSLTISQRLFNTTEVVIIMHAGCGLREITDEQFTAQIQADVGLRPTWRAETFHDSTAEARHGMARPRSSPFLHHATHVHAFVFDENTGALRQVEAIE